MKEESNILTNGRQTIIMNGGNPLNDCPIDWDDANKWEEAANANRGDDIRWRWDCGFKLDFDGPLVSISSRFYPPKTHYGPTWDGTVNVYVLDKKVSERKFDYKTLEELREAVESYVETIKAEIVTKLHP